MTFTESAPAEASCRLLVPDMPLVAGSAVARALLALMTGEPIVHLDCAPNRRITVAAAITRRLMLCEPSSTVTYLTTSQEKAANLAGRTRERLVAYRDLFLPFTLWNPIEGSTTLLRRPSTGGVLYGQLKVDSGFRFHGDARTSPPVSDLLVVGFDDKPWRGLAVRQPAATGRQLLVVGPRADWHDRVVTLLDKSLPWPLNRPADAPWGDIPLEVLLAGGSE